MSSPSEQAVQTCPACQAAINIEQIEPLSEIVCPECGFSMVVRGVIDHFELISVAGRGGMGVVYKARDMSLDREVALKLLRIDRKISQELISQLETEAAITASINDSNVVKVYSTGMDRGRFYIAMELVDKGSLDDLIRIQGRVNEGQVLSIGVQVARGLMAAHNHGMIHRDVKPGNILFADAQTAKIVDFGLAIFMAQEESVRGEIWGTPYYVAPEKLDNRPEDFRSDIYSLGGTLFHAIAGRPPFEAENASLVALKHLKSHAVSIQTFAPWVSGATAFVINRMLHKEPEQRYQSYEELIEHLEYAQGEAEKRASRPAATNTRMVLEDAESQKAMSWITFGMLGLIVLFAIGGLYLFRGQLFPGGSKPKPAKVVHEDLPTPKPSERPPKQPPAAAEVATVRDERLQQPYARLAEADFAGAISAFQKVERENPKQPDLNWATYGEGMAHFGAGHLAEGKAAFKRILNRGPIAKGEELRVLSDFFMSTAEVLAGDDYVRATAASTLDRKSFESLGFLAYGFKDVAMGKFDEAHGHFGQFRAAAPPGNSQWMGDLKPLAVLYCNLDNFFKESTKQLKAATSPQVRAEAAEQLASMAPGFAEKGRELSSPYAADIAAAQKQFEQQPKPGVYRLLNRKSRLFLDVSTRTTEERARTVQSAAGDFASQQWRLEEAGSPQRLRLVAMHSGKALSAERKGPEDGMIVRQLQLEENPIQYWRLVSTGRGWFKLVNESAGKLLTGTMSAVDANWYCVQSADVGGPEQEWRLLPVGGSGSPAPVSATPAPPGRSDPAPALPTPTPKPADPPPGVPPPNVPGAPLAKLNSIAPPPPPPVVDSNGNKGTPVPAALPVNGTPKEIESYRGASLQMVSGDFIIYGKLQSPDKLPADLDVGLIMRDSMEPGGRVLFLGHRPKEGLVDVRRAGTDNIVKRVVFNPPNPTSWIMLYRKGGIIYTYFSEDGQNWRYMIRSTFAQMGKEVYVGEGSNAPEGAPAAPSRFESITVGKP